MSETLHVCARDGCDNTYLKRTHNQKFCSKECCQIQTNSRIMEKYYERRAQRLGKIRLCSQCGITKLSRYNNDSICNSCVTKQKTRSKAAVLQMVEGVTWD